ncbi:hypothetical protein SS1G_10929 [Sclerotinia sclerotiorum 1980 UF-70]|uniref:Uncharacterized protein n=2 Tax=Sclerotinia sclerotiorum (strain ATCC 18683 / 1980 / Ss-1) TaxID=665079 RepID=A0A1D9QB14_SCLS1|nr:hypothetical protein SS1G_10929 [Sclerotinia sclerotiorum 1980 UF-70]APA12111.1 hypothetical protein sscle_09g068810 [Sclerotinia sclerotiorum 1980 UF-70]EDN95054.1 hypothetical protein SS1G_10929 [Sclerotinia sclerotiorum 1980 UF-70]
MASSLTRLEFYTSNLQSFLSSYSAFRILRSLSPPIPIPSDPPKSKNLSSITFKKFDRYSGPLYSLSNDDHKDEPSNDSNQNHSVPPSNSSSPQTLYILDSSFNPPTLAHAHICLSALRDHFASDLRHTKARLLLLLSTQNADKKISGASLEERLVGMECFATDLLNTWFYPHSHYPRKRQVKSEIDDKSISVSEEKNESGDEESAEHMESDSTSDSDSEAQSTTSSLPPSQNQIPFDSPQFDIDIGLTSLPYFHSKSIAIEASSVYPKGTTHVHCTGYDTLIRVLNPKYYPTYDFTPLIPFLSNHKLRVTYRSDKSLSLSDQDTYLSSLPTQLPTLGGKSEWISEKRIYMSPGLAGEEISSTRVRAAIKSLTTAIPYQRGAGSKKRKGKGKTSEEKIKKDLKVFVGANVKKWILGEKLYWWQGKK